MGIIFGPYRVHVQSLVILATCEPPGRQAGILLMLYLDIHGKAQFRRSFQGQILTFRSQIVNKGSRPSK